MFKRDAFYTGRCVMPGQSVFYHVKQKSKKCVLPFKQDPGKLERLGLYKQPLASVCLLNNL